MAAARSTRVVCAPLAPAAAARCANLHKISFSSPWSAAEFGSLLASASVVADGVGSAPLVDGFILSRRAADEAEILTIAVDPAKRAHGLGNALLGFHLSRLSMLGVEKLFLEVAESNKPALALYNRYGFERVGLREGYYAKPDGTRAAALILRCNL